jgi:hypothetical protein
VLASEASQSRFVITWQGKGKRKPPGTRRRRQDGEHREGARLT